MKKFFVISLMCLFVFIIIPKGIHAATTDELQQMRTDKQNQLNALLEQQKVLQAQLDSISAQGNNLTSAVKTLDATRTKIANDIKITQSKITTTDLTIKSLENSMVSKQSQIVTDKSAIYSALKKLSEYDSHSLLIDVLNDANLSEVWADQETLSSLQDTLVNNIDDLRTTSAALAKEKTSKEENKKSLVSLQGQLGGQKSVVEQTKAEKAALLAQTKNQESAYQKMLADNIAQEKQFEADLFNYESQLKVTLDPSSIPSPRHGILSWPLTDIYVTQMFGASVSARRLYVSGTHNGVDFRASVGTPVFAALSGVVTDTEPTKIKAGCQYGKWVLIKHPNGLSTIYGHFSSVLVSPGQTIQTGQLIGYSGSTGYATGPHLHLGLYQTAGIRIVDAGSLRVDSNCVGIKTVAAPPNAYLDPLAYLPPLN